MPSLESTPVVLGVDPGSRVTGYGVISQCGARLIHVASGLLRAPETEPFENRLRAIHDGLLKVVRETSPDVMVLESVFHSKNVRSAIILAHARGAALVAAAHAGLEVAEYSPMEVKRATVGYGRASKEQIAEMVQRLFRVPAVPADAADALAVALCHVNFSRTLRRIERAADARRRAEGARGAAGA